MRYPHGLAHRRPFRPGLLAFLVIVSIAAPAFRQCPAQAFYQAGGSNGQPDGFSQNVGLPGPVIHDPNFGSPFYNQPFTMGEVLRNQGQLPPIRTKPAYNTASCLSLPAPVSQPLPTPGPGYRGSWINYNLGTLGIVSPGWAGYPFYPPYSSFGYPSWGYPCGTYPAWGYPAFTTPYAFGYPASGLPYGWVPFWVQPVNRLLPNYGLIFSISEIVSRGNGRFGPIRPVRDLRNRNQNNGGIVLPGANNAQANPAAGLNAVAPIAIRPPAPMPQGPADPLRASLDNPVVMPAQAAPDGAANQADRALRKANFGVVQGSRDRLGIRRAEGRSAVAGGNSKKVDEDIHRLLQGADRLARNGLINEARTRYQALADRLQTAPEPWFRLAQLEVIAGHHQAAALAWSKASELAGQASPGYTKNLKWSDIADQATRDEALHRLDEWSDAGALAGLRATISPGTVLR